ncbi:MAG: DUF1641 domain-containing protein [Pseudomonadota bacterium]
MSDTPNAELVAMMKAMMGRLDRIEARLDALQAPAPPETGLVRAVDGALARAAADGLDVDARAQALVGMMEVLTRPEMAGMLQIVGQHAHVFTALLNLLARSPETLELVTLTLTGFMAQQDEHGRSIEDQINALMSIAKRATQPAVLEQLNRGLDLFEQTPDLYVMVVDTLQGMIKQVIDLEGDIPSRLEAGLKLMELATRPAVTDLALDGLGLLQRNPATLRRMVRIANIAMDRLEGSTLDLEGLTAEGFGLLELCATPENIVLARRALALVAKLDGTALQALDLAEKLVTDLQQPGFAFEERARVGLALMEKLSEPAMLKAIQGLTESGVMDPAVLALVGKLGGALQKTATGEIQRRSMFAAMGAMLDPNTQRALGFGLAFASELGQALDEPLLIEG